MLYTLYTAARYFLRIVNAAIIIYCILTWVAPRSAARYWLERFINPFVAPFRRLGRYICMRWGSPFDLTCFFALIAIGIVDSFLPDVYLFLARLF